MTGAVRLRTRRLLLREWRESDFEPFAAYYDDPEQSRFVGGPQDRESAWRRLAALVGHWSLRGFGYWAVEERSTGRLIGAVGLWQSAEWPEVELGYWLMPVAHGRGYATEAAERARNYAFETLGVDTLVSYIAPENEASKRVAERLGARHESDIELATFGPHAVYRYPRPPRRWTLATWR